MEQVKRCTGYVEGCCSLCGTAQRLVVAGAFDGVRFCPTAPVALCAECGSLAVPMPVEVWAGSWHKTELDGQAGERAQQCV